MSYCPYYDEEAESELIQLLLHNQNGPSEVLPKLNVRELKQRRRQRQRQRKHHPKIYPYFICATSRLFQLVLLLQKWRTIQEQEPITISNGLLPGTKMLEVAYKLRKKMKNSPSCVHVLHKNLKCGHFTLLF